MEGGGGGGRGPHLRFKLDVATLEDKQEGAEPEGSPGVPLPLLQPCVGGREQHDPTAACAGRLLPRSDL